MSLRQNRTPIIALLSVLIAFSLMQVPHARAAQVDPVQMALRGVPVVDAPVIGTLSDEELAAFPLHPLDRDAFEGARHGFVQTTSGRFGFRVVDLKLPSRVSMEVARVYDSGIRDSVPGVPVDDDPRLEHDLGANWLFSPAMMMVIPTGTGYLLITDEGGSVPYGPDPQGSGDYIPLPDRPLKYGRLTPLTSQGKLKMQMANGNTRTLGFISPQPNYWLEKEEDRSGNYVEYQYYQGYLKKMVSSNGHWIEFHRPQWGESAPAGTPDERVVALTDSTGRRVEYAFDSNECLQTVTDLDGHDWSHTYHDPFRISTLLDPLSSLQ